MYFRVKRQLFENEWIVHILCCFYTLWAAIILHVRNILRAPFLPRAPPFYTAHGRLINGLLQGTAHLSLYAQSFSV